MNEQLRVAMAGPTTLVGTDSADVNGGYRLGSLHLSDLVRLGQAMRGAAHGAESMEDVASRIVQHLFDACVDPLTKERDIVLVRMFKTHPFGDLDRELQLAARSIAGAVEPADTTKCLVLLATAGVHPAWNSRRDSGGHKSIPLLSDEFVARIPMISQLIRQFGLPIAQVVQAAPELMIELDERSYNVFHVEEALGSPYIPAQAEFVEPWGVRSVLGFGGMLPTGNLFAVIVFSRTHIPRATAESLRAVALSVKTAILGFEDAAVFSSRMRKAGGETEPAHHAQLTTLRSKSVALEELGQTYDRMVIEQSTFLEQTVRNLEIANIELNREIETRQRVEAEREELHERLLAESHRAGMSAVATEVLHNVGNVLNSINISINLALEAVRGERTDRLLQTVEMIERRRDDLAEFLTSDPQGRQLPSFLRLLAESYLRERQQALDELKGLAEKIDGVSSIIAMQQSYAGNFGVLGEISPSQALEDALRLKDDVIERCRIEILRRYAEVPMIVADKQKLMQILMCLISNAVDALAESLSTPRQLILRLSTRGDDRVEISVTDNGVGISPDVFPHIFSYGFTTKAQNLSWGLHGCANAARQIGGALTAQSDGLGRGATFTLELPVRSAIARASLNSIR